MGAEVENAFVLHDSSKNAWITVKEGAIYFRSVERKAFHKITGKQVELKKLVVVCTVFSKIVLLTSAQYIDDTEITSVFC